MTKNVKRSFQAVFGVSIAGFLIVLGSNLGAIIDSLKALPEVLANFAKVLPGGSGMFFAVLLISGFVWLYTFKYLHDGARGADAVRPGAFWAEGAALTVACVLMMALDIVYGTAEGATRAQEMLKAIMLGLIAGFSSPFVFKGAKIGWDCVVRNTVGEEDEEA